VKTFSSLDEIGYNRDELSWSQGIVTVRTFTSSHEDSSFSFSPSGDEDTREAPEEYPKESYECIKDEGTKFHGRRE